METIFFVKFITTKGHSDRREYFKENKTILEFHLWIEEKRKDIENEDGVNAVVENILFIQK